MVYCDHNAGTPLRAEVLEAMLPFLRDECGNPSSVHARGSRARCAIETARAEVASVIGAQPAEIVFTSGGTEANNLAILGTAQAEAGALLSTAIEHSSVRACLQWLRERGRRVLDIALDPLGSADPAALAAMVAAEDVALISVGWANNEIGTIQPMAEIAALRRPARTRLHVDAVQAAGKIALSTAGIDLLSLSAHKFGGPKGTGALFVRRGCELPALVLGGGQERGRRSGTENVAGIVGMGAACRLAAQEASAYAQRCTVLRERLWQALTAGISGLRRNSPAGAQCLPNTLNVSLDGVSGETLVAALDLMGIAVSSGSACAAGAGEPSHVLLALGRSPQAARSGVRFSFGYDSGAADVEAIVAATTVAVRRIRAGRERAADAA